MLDLGVVEDLFQVVHRRVRYVLGFEPPVGLAGAGPSETLLPLDTSPDPDKTLDVPAMPEDEKT